MHVFVERIKLKTKKHNEHCKDCKASVRSLLAYQLGVVEANWDLKLSAHLVDYKGTEFYDRLGKIYAALGKHRGHDQFVKSKKLPRVDYFIRSKNIIVEFDESQHFTKPRDITLSLYPNKDFFGFSVNKWRNLCQKLNKRDNDPYYRDEQRAWYDTLRDFAPLIWGDGKTVRLYASDFVWCSFSPDNEADLKAFKQLLKIGKETSE